MSSPAPDLEADSVGPSDQLPSHKQLLKLCMVDEEAAAKLAPVLRKPIVTDNPYDRDIAEFIQLCMDRYGEPPGRNDWRVRIGELADGDDGRRQTLTKAVGRILDTSISEHNRGYLLDVAERTLQQLAARNAHSIWRGLSPEEATPEALRDLWERVDSIGVESDDSEARRLDLSEFLDYANEEVETVVPRLAWRGYMTILPGAGKLGKSTLLTAAACAVMRGSSFLDGEAQGGSVLWARMPGEEPPGQLKSRLLEFLSAGEIRRASERGRFHYSEPSISDPLPALEEDVQATDPDLVVVDSLEKLAVHRELEAGDANGWTRLLGRLNRLAEEEDCALDIIHHARRDGEYRGSAAIKDCADMLITMQDRPDPRRLLIPEGYLSVSAFEVELAGLRSGNPEYRLVQDDAGGDSAAGDPLQERIVATVARHPGESYSFLKAAVDGDNNEVWAAAKELVSEGVLENRGSDARSQIHVADRAA